MGEGVPRSPASPFLRDAQQALEHAQRAFERGRLKEAIGLLEQALKMGAESAAVRTMLGIAYARTYQVDSALEQLERAVALRNPSNHAVRSASCTCVSAFQTRRASSLSGRWSVPP